MKKAWILLFAIALVMGAKGQNTDKLSDEMQLQLKERQAPNEQFRIIINMADEYDQDAMSRQVLAMKKDERRAYVISELQRHALTSQSELMAFLDEGVKQGSVSELTSFWVFNGISCVTNREMIVALSERKDIAFIESDELRNMLPEHEFSTAASEPKRGLAWHVSQVHANDVWSLGYDGSGVVVAIIDTGVNYNHTDVADHMWNGGSSYPYHGYDFVNNDNNPMDDNGHGSHCAGITAGDGTSGTQTGIAPNATIMALKVLNASGSGSSTAITNAIQFAVNNNADVVSMSLGTSGASGQASYRQIFINMLNAGIVASIAAGNDGEIYSTYAVPKNIGSPGNCPPPWHNPDQTLTGGQSAVITIGASNCSDGKSTFSSFGPVTWYGVTGYNDYRYQANNSTNIGLIKPDIIVPGTDITSLLYSDNTGYVEECGTSMATPLASGIMALMLQANPNLLPAQIDQILETTAFPVEFRTSKNNYTGAGRGDALAAIDAILTQSTKPTNLSLETCGGNVNLSWTASTAPAGYCIYRDNVQVGTTTETSYNDENIGTGKHVYYVRANDNNGRQSIHSNCVVCTIQPYATVPENLSVEWDGTFAALEWDASTVSNPTSHGYLYYVTGGSTVFGANNNTAVFWGMRFLPEDLRACQGMSIDTVTVAIYETGLSYKLNIYRGTNYGNTTGTAVYSQNFTPSSTAGFQTIKLTTPYVISDVTEDLWITISTRVTSSEMAPVWVDDYDGPSSNCFYMSSKTASSNSYSTSNIVWEHVPDYGSDYNYAVSIIAHLTRTTNYTPTYNVYLDNTNAITGLSTPVYVDSPMLHEGDNVYNVTSVVNGNESCPSTNATIMAFMSELLAGWNWWAPIVVTDNMLDQLQHAPGVLLITSQSGDPVSSIVPGQMYKIQTSETVNLNMIGVVADLNTLEITIAPDINWFGYPGKTALNINAMNITPADGDKIISQDEGFATYQNGAWTGTLTTLQPGHGYIYVSVAQEDKTLRF